MSSLVLDLQKELMQSNCDVLSALRKAHMIATKLKLNDFDEWINLELNGYAGTQDDIPDYRMVHGQLKALNPYRGWVPVILQDQRLEDALCSRKMAESISDLIELYNRNLGKHVLLTLPADISNKLNELSTVPFPTTYSIHVSTHYLKSITDQITNCLLEWTLKLESEGILGENMSFNQEEKDVAKSIPQQINYYAPVINGNVSNSQIVTGNENMNTYNVNDLKNAVEEIRTSLQNENISSDDMDSALELLDEISTKLSQNKKSGIIKSSLIALKDFVLGVGADITAALITAKIQGLF